MTSVKIFVTYKDKHKTFETDIIKSIQTGRDNDKQDYSDMLGDNIGENISILNNSFCEMSAIYWCWKNYAEIGNPDYIGFMHYRRHFLFGDKKYHPNFYGLVKFSELDRDYLINDLTSDQNIRNVVFSCDAVVPQKIDIKKTTNIDNNYEHYKYYHDIEDYNRAIEIIRKKFPEMMKLVNEYNMSSEAYFLNMFIFKKSIFFDYCEWIFSILFELKKSIANSQNDYYQNRVFGFIAERLTAIYIFKLLQNKKLKIKHLPVSFIEDIKNTKLLLKKEQKIIPIAVSCSNEYIPQLSVFAQSVMEHSNKNYIYEINVFEHTITKDRARLIEKMFKNSNIKFQFINIGNKLQDFDRLCINKHFSSETYARYFIPNLLPHYDKCIYCDLDIIVQDDLKNLYDIDLKDKSIAACKDWVFEALARDKNIENYTVTTLKLDSSKSYFQGGVQLMNLKKMRNINSEAHLSSLTQSINVLFVDQCIFNYFFRNDVLYLPREWNVQVNDSERQHFNLLSSLDVDIMQQVVYALKNPKAIHYSGGRKPWNDPTETMADIWWQYARKTPFYEEILLRMVHAHQLADNPIGNIITNSDYNRDQKLKYVLMHPLYFLLKKFKYKIKKNLVIGERKSKAKQKYKNVKALLKDAKKLKKNLKKI